MNKAKCRMCQQEVNLIVNLNRFVCEECLSTQGIFIGDVSLLDSDSVVIVKDSAVIVYDHERESFRNEFDSPIQGFMSTFEYTLYCIGLLEAKHYLFDFPVLEYTVDHYDSLVLKSILDEKKINYWLVRPNFIVG